MDYKDMTQNDLLIEIDSLQQEAGRIMADSDFGDFDADSTPELPELKEIGLKVQEATKELESR